MYMYMSTISGTKINAHVYKLECSWYKLVITADEPQYSVTITCVAMLRSIL